MKNVFNRMNHVKDSSLFVYKAALSRCGIKCFLQDKNTLKKHPSFPSYLSLQYALKKHGVASCVIKSSITQIRQMPFPIIARLSIHEGIFLFIESMDETQVNIRVNNNQIKTETIEFFKRYWDETLMVIDYENVKKPSLKSNDLLREYYNHYIKYLLFLSILIVYSLLLRDHLNNNIFYICFLGTTLVGLVISTLYKIRDFNRNNEFINVICHSKNNNKDCSSILDIKDARFFGLFKWSDFGTIYFVILLCISVSFKTEIFLSYSVIISFFAAGYIPYSIIYQKYIAKKWCPLCLATQGVLFVNLLISINYCITTKEPLINFDCSDLFFVGILSLVVISTYSTINSIYLKSKQASQIDNAFRELKMDECVLTCQLQSQNIIATDHIFRIILPLASNHITHQLTIIFNTVCIPCLNKLRELLQIYPTKTNTQIDLIFLLNPEDNQSEHMAISLIHSYLNNKKAFLNILSKYANDFPASINKCETRYEQISKSEKEKIRSLIHEQNNWCKMNQIYTTPQLYLDHKALPQAYDIKDIDLITD